MKKIRVTETRTVDYVPNFEEEFYQENDVETLEEAIKADLESLRKGDVDLDGLAKELATMSFSMEIVEVDDDGTDTT